MEVRDSRRLPGLNVIWDRPCAVAEVALPAGREDEYLKAWEEFARAAAIALEWEPHVAVRRFEGGASLALAAPMDSLLAATDVNEWAAARARAVIEGGAPNELADALPGLRRRVARDKRRHKGLLKLAAAADQHGASLFFDDDCTSVGMGKGSLSFASAALPHVQSIRWTDVHDVPVALVTGTNGKSTSVRLLGAIAKAAGSVAGISTTDWVRVGTELLDQGDYSGPSGARMVLRDQRVELAVLECARGGLSRRGLAVRRARVALVTNVGADHLGEWGIRDLEALADVKLVLARAVQHSGTLVLNADDPILSQRGAAADRARLVWFTLDPRQPLVRQHLQGGGCAATLREGVLNWEQGSRRQRVIAVDEAQFLLGGAAMHNVANALGAIGAATALGIDVEAIATGLRGFASDSVDNPGRLNRFDFGGLCVLCDFAHNPHGMRALLSMTCALPAKRRLVILGQAGDRDDESIRQLASLSAQAGMDRIVVKEMPEHLRGREPGAVVRLIAAELQRVGYPEDQVEFAEHELDAVRRSLEWGRPGDVLLLLLHAQRAAVLEWMSRLSAAAWRPGQPLPR